MIFVLSYVYSFQDSILPEVLDFSSSTILLNYLTRNSLAYNGLVLLVYLIAWSSDDSRLVLVTSLNSSRHSSFVGASIPMLP